MTLRKNKVKDMKTGKTIKQEIYCSRTCRLDTISKNGITYSYKLAKLNLDDLERVIRWNSENGITLYRMSSDMFPFISHPSYYKEYDLEQFSEQLRKIGDLAKFYGQRLTFHPGQFNQLTSHREEVVVKTIIELDIHAKILDMMGIDHQGVMIIHGGSKNGGKEVALERLKQNFKRLSESSQRRLVLENCEMAYAIEDLLPISEMLQIPIVIDYHHHNINPGSNSVTLEELTERVLKIWHAREIVPLFHLSESREGVCVTDSITKRRAHSDYIICLPDVLCKLVQTERIDLDIEAKMKELAVIKLREKYDLKHTKVI
jgi:UV DNA damage endonuclease